MQHLKLLSIIVFSLLSFNSFSQNVGIGTSSPNSSAILDVASTSKGLLLPRVADTSNVTTPAEGLVIYSKADKAPNYFDGSKWNNVADARNNFVPVYGAIKYTLPGTTSIGGLSVNAGPLPVLEYGNSFRTPFVDGLPAGRTRGVDSIIMAKEFDGNSIVFKRAHLVGVAIPIIEIFNFLPGAGTPFYSIKLTNVRISVQSFFISEETGKLTERYTLIPAIIGFKDWVTGKSFGWRVSTTDIVPY